MSDNARAKPAQFLYQSRMRFINTPRLYQSRVRFIRGESKITCVVLLPAIVHTTNTSSQKRWNDDGRKRRNQIEMQDYCLWVKRCCNNNTTIKADGISNEPISIFLIRKSWMRAIPKHTQEARSTRFFFFFNNGCSYANAKEDAENYKVFVVSRFYFYWNGLLLFTFFQQNLSQVKIRCRWCVFRIITDAKEQLTK